MRELIVERYVTATTRDELRALVKNAVILHDVIQRWGVRFPSILKRSQRISSDLDTDWVWQDLIVDYFEFWDDRLLPQLERKQSELERLWYQDDSFDSFKEVIENAIVEPSGKARIGHAISGNEFFPRDGQTHIAYQIKTLEEWHRSFMSWTKNAQAELKKIRVR